MTIPFALGTKSQLQYVRRLRQFDTVPNLPRLIEDHLLRKREQEGERRIVGNAKWRASELGTCLRAQYLQLHLRSPAIVPLSLQSLKRFAVGDTWNEQYKKWFTEMGLLLHEEHEFFHSHLNVGAHADFVVGVMDKWRVGVEVKSVHSKYFWYREKEKSLTTASLAHLIQAGCYDLLSRELEGVAMPWLVIPTSKDDLTMGQDRVTSEHRALALDRLHRLNLAVNTGEPPECECFQADGPWGKNQWTFCDYYAGTETSRTMKISRKVEDEFYKNGKPKYHSVYVPDGECCVI